MKAALVANPSRQSSEQPSKTMKRKLRELTPGDTQYWATGQKGGEQPWKFSCMCGETCSSYENFRYHPVGRMVECSECSIWSHVECILGNDLSDEDLEELEDILCFKCFTKARRKKLGELRDMKMNYQLQGDMVLLSSVDGHEEHLTAVVDVLPPSVDPCGSEQDS